MRVDPHPGFEPICSDSLVSEPEVFPAAVCPGHAHQVEWHHYCSSVEAVCFSAVADVGVESSFFRWFLSCLKSRDLVVAVFGAVTCLWASVDDTWGREYRAQQGFAAGETVVLA